MKKRRLAESSTINAVPYFPDLGHPPERRSKESKIPRKGIRDVVQLLRASGASSQTHLSREI